jgi:hypothetical protein
LRRAASRRLIFFEANGSDRRISWIGLAVLALGTAACVQTFDSAHLGVPVSLAESAQAPVAGDTFRVTKHPVWFFWGMIPAGSPNLEDVLAGQLGTGSRLSNVRIRQRMEFWISLLRSWCAASTFGDVRGIVVPC